MTRDPNEQKKAASDFWKRYFDKFRRPIAPSEVSETAPAPLLEHGTTASISPSGQTGTRLQSK